MRFMMSMLCASTLCAVAGAAELDLAVTSGGNGVVVVEPGATVPYEVTGALSTGGADNEGLSFFIFDLAFDGGALEPADEPVAVPLTHFTAPAGFTNPEGFGGAVIDGVLNQVGGSQNTLKSPLMMGPVVTGVGQTPIVLATGSLTAPVVDGTYTLQASEVLARVIEQGNDGLDEIWVTEWAFEGELAALQIIVGDQCATHGDCADLDDNGVRDDNCVWWACEAGLCEPTDIVFADMGGQFGACAPDGTADGNDRFTALNCFANQNADGSAPYECESAAPSAFNVDAGGPFGDCNPDGVCDGNDAFHALNAFDGSSPCSCGAGPMPEIEPVVTEEAKLELRTDKKQVRPGDTIEVAVYLASPLADLRGYQLHVGVSGGGRGQLSLIDIGVEDRPDGVFSGKNAWTAFNVKTGQMVAGLDTAGVQVSDRAYLATFTYRVSRQAAGQFEVAVLHDASDDSQRTFLFATDPRASTELTVATIGVDVFRSSKRRKAP